MSTNIEETAFYGLRHYSPDAVRSMRTALDNKVPLSDLRKSIKRAAKKQNWGDGLERLALDALAWMSANPNAGKVKWLEGEQYTWEE